MATLTDEQRKRIEENKRKALAIRAAKLSTANSTISNNNTPTGSSYLSNQVPKSPALPITVINSNPLTPQYNNEKASHCKNAFPSENNVVSKQRIDFYNHSELKSVTVNVSLISRDRFTVEFPFNQEIVNLLKTIPGKLYDPKLYRWHFPLSSYENCKTALQTCKTCQVIMKPLPNYILKVFRQLPKVNINYKTIDISRIEDTLTSNLYPFQKEGVQFGISKNGKCIIADDMGLGKTIQAIGIANYYYNDWPLLVVCPSSMRYQWEEEIRNNLPNVPVTKIFVLSKSKDQVHNPLVLITSYDLMSRCESLLMSMKFGVIIMDESHSMKSLKTNRTKTALSLISKAQRCILLSGTPALSRPYELYPQIKALEPHAFSGKEFGLRYCDGKEGKFGWDYSGCSNMEELRILLEERFMIRRLKANVLEQLPSKIRQVVILDKDFIKGENKKMTAIAAKLQNDNFKGMERRGTLLSYYAETAKIKLKAIKDYICQILETGSKFLVFAHHKEVLDGISDLLEEKKTYFIRIDGSVSSDERKSVCDQFQFEEKFRVAVLSITAASTGLTLTAANLVIFAELFWNPGILTQAEDRAHRIGQVDSVLIQYLMAMGTADDYLWPLIKTKLNILNQAGLSKDNFACERTTMVTNRNTIMNYFNEIEDCDEELNRTAEEVEKCESKRMKLCE